MDTEKYRALLCCLDRGSLSAAAEQLGYTPSGISRMIAALEGEMGFPLLFRSRHGVEATAACAQLLPALREAVHWDDRLVQQVAQLNGMEVGAIYVGTAYSAYYGWLSSLLLDFRRSHPGISIHFLEGTSSQLCQAVEERRADLCIVSQRQGDFRWLPLREDALLALVPSDHPLAQTGSFPIAAFATEPFIDIYHGQETDNSRLLAQHGIRPNIQFTTPDSYAAQAMVEAGLGVSLINSLLTENWQGNFRLLPLEPPQTVTIGLAFSGSASPAAKRLLRFATERAAQL